MPGKLANLVNLEYPVPRPTTIERLLLAAVALPIVCTVVVALGRLLAAMGDAAGATLVDRLALAAGVLWVFVLITLVLLLAAARAFEPPSRTDDASDEIDEP